MPFEHKTLMHHGARKTVNALKKLLLRPLFVYRSLNMLCSVYAVAVWANDGIFVAVVF